jgi:hypothetical protein
MKVLLAFVFRIFELPSLFFFLELARGAGAPFFLGVFRRSFSFFPFAFSTTSLLVAWSHVSTYGRFK